MHTPLAFLMFVSQAAIQTSPLICHKSRACPRTVLHACRVAGCLYLWLSLLVTVLMVSHVITKVNTTISIFEWSGSLEILVYLWWYMRSTVMLIPKMMAVLVVRATVAVLVRLEVMLDRLVMTYFTATFEREEIEQPQNLN